MTSARARVGIWAVAVATVAGFGLLPDTAHARQFKCEHPSDGYCVANDSTKLVACVCGGETTEVDRDDLRGTTQAEFEKICWEVWSDVCSAWSEAPATCDEPGLGTCEVDGRDGGSVSCACEDGRQVDETDYDEVGGFAGDALQDVCDETLQSLCRPAAAPVTPAMGPAPAFEPEPRASSGCAIAPASRGGLSLALLVLVAACRRRTRPTSGPTSGGR